MLRTVATTRIFLIPAMTAMHARLIHVIPWTVASTLTFPLPAMIAMFAQALSPVALLPVALLALP